MVLGNGILQGLYGIHHAQFHLSNSLFLCLQFIFSTAIDGKIKAWLYDCLGSRVDYDAPGHWCTMMAYSADGTRWSFLTLPAPRDIKWIDLWRNLTFELVDCISMFVLYYVKISYMLWHQNYSVTSDVYNLWFYLFHSLYTEMPWSIMWHWKLFVTNDFIWWCFGGLST